MPIEQLARRGHDTLAFGPMRPVGLTDPHTGGVRMRSCNCGKMMSPATCTMWSGFQTNIRWKQQREVLRLIPGLEQAEFVRMGQMHRNTFLNAPALLHPTMRFRGQDLLYFAGQITGVEGYVGNIATGLLAALNLSRQLAAKAPGFRRLIPCWARSAIMSPIRKPSDSSR